MGYPHPRQSNSVHTLSVAALGAQPLAALQRAAQQLSNQQLLCVQWVGQAVPLDDIVDALATFHSWLPERTQDDSGYVLHFLPSPEQLGELQHALAGRQATAAVWDGARLRLVGSVSDLWQQLVDAIVATPGLTSKELGRRFCAVAGEHHVANQLSELAHRRVVSRWRDPRRTALLRGPRPWHYLPLWLQDPSIDSSGGQPAAVSTPPR